MVYKITKKDAKVLVDYIINLERIAYDCGRLGEVVSNDTMICKTNLMSLR